MRTLLVAAALVLPLLAPPATAAEEPGLTDPAGDVVFELGGGGQTLPSVPASAVERAKSSDLLSLRASETDDTIDVSLQVASLAGSSVFTNARVLFGWSGGDFELSLFYARDSLFLPDARAWAVLARADGGDGDDDDDDGGQDVARLTPTVDAASATLSVAIPKVYLVSEDNRVPGRGDVVAFSVVETNGNAIGLPFGGARAYDRMPDAEGDPAELTLARGDFSQGSLVLTTRDRVRVSNGGATTFVFQVTLRNSAPEDDEYALAIAEAPEGWNTTVQSPVKVPGNGERTIGVLVSVPFAHEHGGYSSFNLTAQSARDPATQARLRMGVLHTPIPQPAGHHAELYLHAAERQFGGPLTGPINTAFPSTRGWMNTESDHSEDAGYVTPTSMGEEIEWRIPLNPALQLGLDFDVEGLGELSGSILGKRSGEATLTATLYYETGEGDGADRVALAEGNEVPLTLDGQQATAFAMRLTPTPESDYIAYTPGARLTLFLAIEPGRAADLRWATTLDPQLLVEDFVLSLPLNEYHDRLTGVAEAAQSIEILARGAVEKAGLPGSVLTYAFTLRNGGPPDVFVVDLAGNDAHEGIVVPRGALRLDTGESREVTVAVELPVDANPGQEFEVLLFVHARDDPSKMAIARTKTRATDAAGEAAPDETHLLLDAQARNADTPGAGAMLVLAGLAVASLAARRRG